MDDQRIEAALREASDTRSVTIGAGANNAIAAVFSDCFGTQAAVIVADEITFALAGEQIQQRLQHAGIPLVEPFIFPGRPTLYADHRNVQALEASLQRHAAIPIVVGSGTLNDITKLAAHRCRRPYLVVATAASMDGYTAFGAAITDNGFKRTFACPAPVAVVADLDILAQAPLNMTASGYADLLGKITAGADWIIADALEIEPIIPPVWSLVQDSLRAWTGRPHLLVDGDRQAIEQLVEGLILTGLAMQATQSSRPASGSEHQFSHLWEMQEQTHGSFSHGFKVGLGSIASAALYQRLLERDLRRLDVDAVCRDWPSREALERSVRQAHPDPVLAEKAVEQSLAKYISAVQLKRRLRLLQERWPGLRERLAAQLLKPVELATRLQAAGCPTDPARLGLDQVQLRQSYALARQIRSRYTVFDLAAETGTFEDCIAELFRPGGFWADLPVRSEAEGP